MLLFVSSLKMFLLLYIGSGHSQNSFGGKRLGIFETLIIGSDSVQI